MGELLAIVGITLISVIADQLVVVDPGSQLVTVRYTIKNISHIKNGSQTGVSPLFGRASPPLATELTKSQFSPPSALA